MEAPRDKILLVEDEPALRSLVQVCLRDAGFHVFGARDAADALRLLDERGSDFDLLVADVVLPDRDGRELAEELGARIPGLAVLLMSGYAEDAESAPELLRKPFTPAVLVRRVRELLSPAAED